MKSKATTETKTTEPRLSMQAKILSRDQDGQISDATHQGFFSLKNIAEDGERALRILNNCMKRLDLLYIAAESRPSIDASLIRLAINDIRIDLEHGGELASYIELTHELFSHSEALAPR